MLKLKHHLQISGTLNTFPLTETHFALVLERSKQEAKVKPQQLPSFSHNGSKMFTLVANDVIKPTPVQCEH